MLERNTVQVSPVPGADIVSEQTPRIQPGLGQAFERHGLHFWIAEDIDDREAVQRRDEIARVCNAVVDQRLLQKSVVPDRIECSCVRGRRQHGIPGFEQRKGWLIRMSSGLRQLRDDLPG